METHEIQWYADQAAMVDKRRGEHLAILLAFSEAPKGESILSVPEMNSS
jgi:hypothetical protein